jgi:tricorn protease-like protein
LGLVAARIAPGKGQILSLTASPDGHMLYFAAGDAIWAVAASGGEAKKISDGLSAVMSPNGNELVVTRVVTNRVRLY